MKLEGEGKGFGVIVLISDALESQEGRMPCSSRFTRVPGIRFAGMASRCSMKVT